MTATDDAELVRTVLREAGVAESSLTMQALARLEWGAAWSEATPPRRPAAPAEARAS